MYLIVGLGNPESEYEKTRHNMGFNVINVLAKEYEIDVTKSKFKGLYGQGTIEENKVILLKPQTYMNLSGESIREIMNFYKIEVNELIVVYDDVDIEQGNIRIREDGSSGTHNGMKSVIQNLGTEEFVRIRVGIGKKDNNIDIINYVLGAIPEEDREFLNDGIIKAKNAVIDILKNNINFAMNKYN